jgi:hypothetical protein
MFLIVSETFFPTQTLPYQHNHKFEHPVYPYDTGEDALHTGRFSP